MSQARARPSPKPNAGPATAAMVGTSQRRTAVNAGLICRARIS
ncbi:hypothetical protein Y027_5868 [Burkholderia pseudomallei TSV5]|nr:hypothetical protein X945_5996 [Burkholderia pseudomallei ABCPW 107]KGX48996.1 hypothetical protein Y025_5766 [Burkholderia pseudomallei TSV32]KGX49022.1 hypothetical protein Y027_5868 [Burkholderia pseudomallei TSV5]